MGFDQILRVAARVPAFAEATSLSGSENVREGFQTRSRSTATALMTTPKRHMAITKGIAGTVAIFESGWAASGSSTSSMPRNGSQ